MRQSSFLQAEIVADGKVIAATDAKGGAFKAGVQQRHTPVPSGFEVRNGASEFMRPLYGWHGDDDIRQPKRSMPCTGDRPKVAPSPSRCTAMASMRDDIPKTAT